MATKRNVPSAISSKESKLDSPIPKEYAGKQTSIPKGVVAKLLLFTAAMIVAPLASYFLTVDRVFNGNTTYSAATAAIVANIVLIGYVIVAFQEEAGEDTKKKR